LAIAGLAVLASCGLADSAMAGTVTTSLDGNGAGTLRTEVTGAASGDVITVAPGVNPIVSLGQIQIAQPITIQGQGVSSTEIIGGASRLFVLSPPLVVADTITIEDLTMRNAHPPRPAPSALNSPGANGGAVFVNAGNLVLDNVEMQANQAGDGGDGTSGGPGNPTGFPGNAGGDGGNGGSIYVGGTGSLTISNSAIGGSAGDGGNGGNGGNGIVAGAPGGGGGGGGSGGAIYADAPVTITDTTFLLSSAGAGGGGGNGSVALIGPGPGVAGGSGGPGGYGGAIAGGPSNSLVTISGSTFDQNSGGAGGSAGTGGDGGNGGDGGPGGLGGAISGTNLTLTNSTVVGNAGGTGAAGGSNQGNGGDGGDGGGVAATGGAQETLTNDTFLGNIARPGAPGFVAGFDGQGGNVFGFATLRNSIFANGFAEDTSTANCEGTIVGDGFNLNSPAANGCPGAVAPALPMSSTLADNGGPTQTLALFTGSPALDMIPPTGANCPATDQRGVTRPQGSACDIGAFELAVTVPPVPTPAPTPTPTPAAPAKKKCKKHKKKRHATAAKKKKCKKKRK
jgi:hypothetical protein